MRILCLYFPQPQDLQALAEMFYRYSPQIAMRSEKALFVEIEKCRHLYREESLVMRTRSMLKRLKLNAQLSVAEDIPTALSFAQFQIFQKEKLPLEALNSYAFPYETPEKSWKPLQLLLETLQKMGLKNLKDFQKISARSLSNRFGPLGLHLHRAVQDSSALHWPLYKPPESLIEEQALDYELRVDNFESISFVLKALLDRLMLRLRGRGQALRKFTLVLELEPHSLLKEKIYRLSFDLFEPQMSLKTLLGIVRDRVQFELQQKPLGSPVIWVRLEAQEMVPWIYAQKDLFNPHREEKREQQVSVLSRLQTRLGSEKVFRAEPIENYLPEKNWCRREPFHWREFSVTDRHPSRPLRLLPEPQKIFFQEGWVMIAGRRLKVLSVNRHEVLCGEIWNRPFERRYSILRVESEDLYWVFVENENLYLHGVFD